ncbi:hypothetical protein F4V57_06945 [Acinetobacter qingfengensis]|uniref:DUF342 domain-containing protein n=1 Tax=Acinetobacter qingfengensis TaxID=1262585 RepID=A0A1E7R337_9GAMM|nr:hypothetical protein [Acinetobacter qingfengensis]KAA8733783.1 hypothetical protein F4V57_06945 [Acinetobacter qingfengensis]OEY93706.1 hypothetical protein BJI46_04485 [Acinetobacter qingfengensis]
MSNYSKSQQGAATILMVLLVGFALISSILGTAYYLRMQQQVAMASHALTNAQQGAWAGVEVVRQYLEKNITQIAKETAPVSLSINSKGANQITAKITNITGPTNNQYKITAQIQNNNKAAKSTSTIEVVYNVNVGSSGGEKISWNTDNAMDIHSKLTIVGGVKLIGESNLDNDEDKYVTVNVDGAVDGTAGNGLTGIDILNATGDVSLGSSSQFKKIYSNGDIYLTGSAAATVLASAGKTIQIDSGEAGIQGKLYANGDIIINNGITDSAYSLCNIYVKDKSPTIKTLLQAGGATSVDYCNEKNKKFIDNDTIESGKLGNVNLEAVKSVSDSPFSVLSTHSIITKAWITIDSLKTQGELICGGGGFNGYKSLIANSWSTCSNLSIAQWDGSSLFTPEGAQKVVSMVAPKIDANDYKTEANYIFSLEEDNTVKVTLQNMSNTNLNGKTYYSGLYNGIGGYLCENKDCTTTPIAKISSITWGYQTIKYDGSKWIVNANNNSGHDIKSKDTPSIPVLSPGILFFDGDIEIGAGSFINSFIVTGDITFNNSGTAIYAPNYAGRSQICTMTYYPTSAYPYLKPSESQLCIPLKNDKGEDQVAYSSGNIALLAGSYKSDGTYQGGNITLSNAYIYGNIIAGNHFYTTASTNYVVGGILAALLSGDGSSNFGNALTVDLSNISTHSDFISGTPIIVNGDPTVTAKIKWARYL